MCGEPKQPFGMSALRVVHCALFICALCVVQVYSIYSTHLCLAPPSLCFRYRVLLRDECGEKSSLEGKNSTSICYVRT